jgi:hypothetical protein
VQKAATQAGPGSTSPANVQVLQLAWVLTCCFRTSFINFSIGATSNLRSGCILYVFSKGCALGWMDKQTEERVAQTSAQLTGPR